MEEFFHGAGFFPTDGGGCCLVGQVKLLVLRCDAGGYLLIDSGVQLVRFGFLPYCDGVGLLFLLPAAVASGLVEWILGLLDLVLLLLEMCAGVSWLRWISSIVEERGDDAGSSRPTTDAHELRISCSFPTFGVRLSIWIRKFGGLMLEHAFWRTVGRSRQLNLRKKKNSRDLFVILGLLKVFSVRMGCPVLIFIL